MTVSIFPSLALKTGSLFPYPRKCADLFIEVFTKASWNDTYDSRTQVIDFFQNHMDNDYFVGYGLESQNRMIAASIGMKKPWINGMEYYIDQFYVKTDWQGKGTGSLFLKLIESEIRTEKMNAIILNTEKGFPAENFYLKNGFRSNEELIILSSFIYCDQEKKK